MKSAKFTIKFKLVTLITTITMISTLIGLQLVQMYERDRIQIYLEAESQLVTKLIGEYLVPALIFQDYQGAFDIIKKTKSIDDVSAVIVYDSEGLLFTDYYKPDFSPNMKFDFEKLSKTDTLFIIEDHIVVSEQIEYDNIFYGSLIVFSKYKKFSIWHDQLTVSIFVVLGVVLLVSILLSLALQQIISKPIIDLTKIALQVMRTGDFTLRAKENRYDETGILNRTFNAMLRTITNYYAEREESEQALRENEMRYRALFDYSPIPIFLFEDDICKMLNFSAMQLFKVIERNDVIGNHYREVFKSENQESYDYIFNNRSLNDRRVSFDFVIYDKFNNRKYIELTSMLLHNDGIISLIIMCMDISDKVHFESELLMLNQEIENRVKLRTSELETAMEELNNKNRLMNLKEIELSEAKNEAEHANKIKSQFIANISHEIRTPMNVIKGYSEMLYKRLHEPENVKILKSIVYSSETLLSIIDDILDLSKIEAGKLHIVPAKVDLKKTCMEIQDMFSSRCKDKNLTLTFDYQENLPTSIMIDGTRFNQILFNLISNAIKFTDNGFIKVSCKVDCLTDKSFNLTVEVEDSGIGIKEENLEYIFDAFAQERWQSKASQLGTGLGLTITKRLIESMGGDIEVRSRVGVGTTFRVVINDVEIVNDGSDDRLDSEIAERVLVCNQLCKVLIVDDYELNRKVLRDKLEEYGLQVIEAYDLNSSIHAVDNNQFEIIFIDLLIPDNDGNEIARSIKLSENYNQCPLVVYTASLSFSLSENEYFEAVLTKPIKNNSLKGIITKYLGSKIQETNLNELTKFSDDGEDIEIDKAKLHELIMQIESDWEQQAFLLSENQIIDDIQAFVVTLKSKEDYFSIPIFGKYIDALEKAADEFEISRMKTILTNISSLRAELVRIQNTEGGKLE